MVGAPLRRRTAVRQHRRHQIRTLPKFSRVEPLKSPLQHHSHKAPLPLELFVRELALPQERIADDHFVIRDLQNGDWWQIPFESMRVCKPARYLRLNAGARNGQTDRWTTMSAIRIETRILTRLSRRRESGVVNTIVAMKPITANLFRPIIIQETGDTKARAG